MQYDMQEELVRWLTSLWVYDARITFLYDGRLSTYVDAYGKRFVFKGRV